MVTARYHSLLLVPTFSMNADKPVLLKKKEFYKEFWELLGQFVKQDLCKKVYQGS